MVDPRFFARAAPLSLAALSELAGARLHSPADGDRVLTGVAPLETAGPEDVTFLDNRKDLDALARTRAGAAFIEERLTERAPKGLALLIAREPYKAFALAARAFYPETALAPRRAPSAVIDPTAAVPADCEI